MALIQCTQKLLDELYTRRVSTVAPLNKQSLLGNWHAKMMLIERKKCVLFTNDDTLFSLFVKQLTVSHFQHLRSVFMTHLVLNLTYECLDQNISTIIKEYEGDLNFINSSNHSVMGSMNNMVHGIHCYLAQDGGLDQARELQLNQKLNRIPFKANKYDFAIERLTKKLDHGMDVAL